MLELIYFDEWCFVFSMAGGKAWLAHNRGSQSCEVCAFYRTKSIFRIGTHIICVWKLIVNDRNLIKLESMI